MIIGIPKEIKQDEFRISLPPDKVHLLKENGHKVLVEAGAGLGAGIQDEVYSRAGAIIVNDRLEIFGEANMIIKVKEPQEEELDLFQKGQILFTYLHLAAERKITSSLLKKEVTSIAYETVQLQDGSLPLLFPMSEIAGRLAPQIAAQLLMKKSKGPGKLIGGIPGVRPCNIVILGGGTVGSNAALIATGLGAKVTVLDIDIRRLRYLSYHSAYLETHMATPFNILTNVEKADVVIGAVLIAGDTAPKVVTKKMVDQMQADSIIIDVAIDQGGCVETIKPTSHSDPTYRIGDVIHYAVPNIPGTVPYTASISLSNSTYLYALKLANLGFVQAVKNDSSLAKGVNTVDGQVTHTAVAQALGIQHVPLEELT